MEEGLGLFGAAKASGSRSAVRTPSGQAHAKGQPSHQHSGLPLNPPASCGQRCLGSGGRSTRGAWGRLRGCGGGQFRQQGSCHLARGRKAFLLSGVFCLLETSRWGKCLWDSLGWLK